MLRSAEDGAIKNIYIPEIIISHKKYIGLARLFLLNFKYPCNASSAAIGRMSAILRRLFYER